MNNYDISYLQTLGDKFNFELTAFFAEGENMISVVNAQLTNINSFINKGFEFAASYKVTPSLNISGNYSFLETNTKLTVAPKHKAFLKANWSIDKFTVSPSFQYIDGLYIETVSNAGVDKDIMENYALLNCRVSYKATDCISLFVNGENLTDVSYQTFAGYPMPGAFVLGGFDIKF